jgi:hypothetical protein
MYKFEHYFVFAVSICITRIILHIYCDADKRNNNIAVEEGIDYTYVNEIAPA